MKTGNVSRDDKYGPAVNQYFQAPMCGACVAAICGFMIKQRIQRVCCGLKSTGFCCRTVGVPKYIYIAIQAYVSLDGMSLYEYQKPETPAYVSLGGMSLYEHETPACEMLENSRGSASGFS